MDWEPYGESDVLVHQETEKGSEVDMVEEKDECLEDSELSFHSDESIGSFEMVGNLEHSVFIDSNISDGSKDIDLERYLKHKTQNMLDSLYTPVD